VHSDSAPAFYITGNPARDALETRNFERGVYELTAVNPMTGKTDQFTTGLADPVGLKLLHMITSDPARTPTFVMFANPDYFLFAGAPNCNSPCVTQEPSFAWNSGTNSGDIVTTWLGLVGPGVRRKDQDKFVWSDHTDVRPTILTLLGLKDEYVHDGRVLIEPLFDYAVPTTLLAHRKTLLTLGNVYKMINAPVAQLGQDSLRISTIALASGTQADDSTYVNLEDQLASITAERDNLAEQMKAALNGAEFGNQALSEKKALRLIYQGLSLLDRVNDLAVAVSQ